MKDIVERGYVIIGSPDEVVEQLTEVATDLNVGHLMLLLQFGSMGKDLAATTPSCSPRRVLPSLKSLFSEWEDRWWPQPMARPERARIPAFQSPLAAERMDLRRKAAHRLRVARAALTEPLAQGGRRSDGRGLDAESGYHVKGVDGRTPSNARKARMQPQPNSNIEGVETRQGDHRLGN
jgi:hypothetical protein